MDAAPQEHRVVKTLPIDVTLTEAEIVYAASAGAVRRLRNEREGLEEAHGVKRDDGNGWDREIVGAIGEIAVAKALRVYWNGNGTDRKRPDVGPWDVRSTSLPHGKLIIHKNDPDERVIFLVTGKAPTLSVRGWLRAIDGKRPEYWDDKKPRPAFFVPQDKLHREIRGKQRED